VKRSLRPGTTVAALAGLPIAMLVFGALGFVSRQTSGGEPGEPLGLAGVAPGREAVNRSIASLQARVERLPQDFGAWASLGMAYVQQARISGDPSSYAKAEATLSRSLSINEVDNFEAAAAWSALASARHDFPAAADWARRGLGINPASAPLWGALADAEIQLGRYEGGFDATQRMVDLSPDTPSLARVSYVFELRGEVESARAMMTRALEAAFTDSDRAFVRHQLGELAFNAGEPGDALAQYEAGLAADPSYAPLLAGRAKARAALGRLDEAVADYRAALDRLPQPGYAMELGELLEAQGHAAGAARQYELVVAFGQLFEAAGVAPDVEMVFFEADHGDPGRAVAIAEAILERRGIVDVADAYAWALHRAGRDAEAWTWSQRALSLGTANARFRYHAGAIRHALGDDAGAREHLAAALDLNPHFSPLRAPLATGLLQRLSTGS